MLWIGIDVADNSRQANNATDAMAEITGTFRSFHELPPGVSWLPDNYQRNLFDLTLGPYLNVSF